jgi:hypothetical protein
VRHFAFQILLVRSEVKAVLQVRAVAAWARRLEFFVFAMAAEVWSAALWQSVRPAVCCPHLNLDGATARTLDRFQHVHPGHGYFGHGSSFSGAWSGWRAV